MRLTVLFLLVAGSAFAQIPDSVSYQGFLTRPDGTPLDTTVSVTFTLYNPDGSETGWQETHPSVPVKEGVFDVYLGSILAWNDTMMVRARLLGVSVGDDPEIDPRTPLGSAPYALNPKFVLVKESFPGSEPSNVKIQCPEETVPFQSLHRSPVDPAGRWAVSNGSSECQSRYVYYQSREFEAFCSLPVEVLVYCLRRDASVFPAGF
jgi:hypothetical protein